LRERVERRLRREDELAREQYRLEVSTKSEKEGDGEARAVDSVQPRLASEREHRSQYPPVRQPQPGGRHGSGHTAQCVSVAGVAQTSLDFPQTSLDPVNPLINIHLFI
jgi:hypothetical protein